VCRARGLCRADDSGGQNTLLLFQQLLLQEIEGTYGQGLPFLGHFKWLRMLTDFTARAETCRACVADRMLALEIYSMCHQ
jgi:hypothetical protein